MRGTALDAVTAARGLAREGKQMWFVVDPAGITCICIAYGILIGSNAVVWNLGRWPGGPLGARICLAVYEAWFVLSIWAHLSCMLTDPGGVPRDLEVDENTKMCQKCNAPKPPRAHHCSTCKRCVLKMDHHCPWVNNCVGLRNQKFFLQFVLYVSLQCFAAMCGLVMHFSTMPLPQRRRRRRGFLAKTGMAEEQAMAAWHAEHGARHHARDEFDSQLGGCVLVFFAAIVCGLFTCLMFCDQISNITSDSTGIENLKGGGSTGGERPLRPYRESQKQEQKKAANATKGPWKELLQEVMGRGPSLGWLVPLPVRHNQVKSES